MFPKSINWQKNVADTGFPALGSDADPTVLTDAAATAYLAHKNVFRTRGAVGYGLAQRLVVAVLYTGVGSPIDFALTFAMYDETSRRWFALPGASLTATVGQTAAVTVPILVSPPENNPELEIAVRLDATGQPDGVFTVLLGTDYGAGNGDAPGSPVTGTDVTATPGVATAMSATSVPLRVVTVQNDAGNADTIRVGDSTVSATRGIKLVPGAAVGLEVRDLKDVYIFSAGASVVPWVGIR